MFETIEKITKQLSLKPQLCWGVGGSFLLHQYGLSHTYNDLDIIVSTEHCSVIDSQLTSLGERMIGSPKEPFQSEHFIQYVIDGGKVDVISSFRIKHEEGIYELAFDHSSISKKDIHNVSIPLMTLEDWYVLYQLIPSKEEKANRIEAYFRAQSLSHPQILERALLGALPHRVRNRIIFALSHFQSVK